MHFFPDKQPRARKRHRCFVCQLSIWTGTTYCSSSSIQEGKMHTFREHLECRRVALACLNEWFEETYQGDDVREHLFDLASNGDLEAGDEMIVWMRCKRGYAHAEAARLLRRPVAVA